MVVSVSGVAELPLRSSIEAGDYQSYSLTFDPAGYVPAISDFSVDGDGVQLSLYDGASGKGLRVDVGADVPGSSSFAVKFLDQTIINLTTIEKLTVVSVNGSTDFPLDLEVADGGSLDFTLEFSHYYAPYYTDFALVPSSGGTWNPRPQDTWRFIPSVGSAGATVELYCIETLIARVTVLGEPIHVSPRSVASGSDTVDFSSDIWDKVPGIPSVLEGSSLSLRVGSGARVSNAVVEKDGSYSYPFDQAIAIALGADTFRKFAPGGFYGPEFELLSITIGGVKHKFIDY